MTVDQEFPIIFKPHKRAKRMKLRYDAETESAVVTMPYHATEKSARAFVSKNLNWLENQKLQSPQKAILYPGQKIPYKGRLRNIVHCSEKNARVIIDDTEILVGGPIEGISTRIENFLKKMARKEIEPLAFDMADVTGKRISRIQIRDTKSRWGSCSSTNTLSFSWRLVLAPPEILEYVVAHEVAHLSEMNHSHKFWKIVDDLVDHAQKSRTWLKNEGQSLMLIQKRD